MLTLPTRTRTPFIVDLMPPGSSSRSDMRVFVKLPTGKTVQWMAGDQATMEGIKSFIEKEEGIPVGQQRLLLEAPNGRQVNGPLTVTKEIHFILWPIYKEDGAEPPRRKRKREKEMEQVSDSE